jgi:GNAT superfamily N-acetyltransferase
VGGEQPTVSPTHHPQESANVGSTYEWHCRLLSHSDALDAGLVQQVYDVFRGAFGFEPTQGLDSIRYRLRNSTLLGLLRDGLGGVHGFGCYSVPSVPLGDAYFLWGDGMALMPDVQGRGLTRGLMERACSLYPGRLFGWMGGRTQNPVVFQRYAKFGRVFPFDGTYAEPEGRHVLRYLREHVAEVREAGKIDEVTGICRGAYRWTYLQEYLAQVRANERFEQQLRGWGFNRAHGDALILVVKLDVPIQG